MKRKAGNVEVWSHPLAEKLKLHFVRRRAKYNEQAMYPNPQFKDLVDGGAKVSVACRVLTKREMAPMFYGWAAGGSYWAECLNWASNLKPVITGPRPYRRIRQVDATVSCPCQYTDPRIPLASSQE